LGIIVCSINKVIGTCWKAKGENSWGCYVRHRNTSEDDANSWWLFCSIIYQMMAWGDILLLYSASTGETID